MVSWLRLKYMYHCSSLPPSLTKTDNLEEVQGEICPAGLDVSPQRRKHSPPLAPRLGPSQEFLQAGKHAWEITSTYISPFKNRRFYETQIFLIWSFTHNIWHTYDCVIVNWYFWIQQKRDTQFQWYAKLRKVRMWKSKPSLSSQSLSFILWDLTHFLARGWKWGELILLVVF